MTALLFYSISSDLTSDQIIKIDCRVAEDRKAAYLFFRELPVRVKCTSKGVILRVFCIFTITQSLTVGSAGAIHTSTLPPRAAIHRLSNSEQNKILGNRDYSSQIATIIQRKADKIKLTNEQFKQVNDLARLVNSGSITIEEAILEVRGGDGFTDLVAIFAFVIFVNIYDSFFGKICPAETLPHALPYMDPLGWIGGKYNSKPDFPSSKYHKIRESFIPPSARHFGNQRRGFKVKYPNQGFVDSNPVPAPTFTMNPNPPVRSTDSTALQCVPTHTQASTFENPDGSMNLEKAYQEVMRRARFSDNFDCSLERFTELSTEAGGISAISVRAAISALQLEADGVVSNVRRDPLGEANKVKGFDFLIEGPNGETHLEIKGPVGSAIRREAGLRPSVRKQAKKLGSKIDNQLNYWFNPDNEDRSKVTLPTDRSKVIIVNDLYDVPVTEKLETVETIKDSVKSNHPIKFINEITNR